MDNFTNATGTTTSPTSLEKYIDFQPRHVTHMNRFVSVITRCVRNSNQWTDAMRLYPIDSFESKVIFDRLAEDFKILDEEMKETLRDLMDDQLTLADVFKTFQEEIGQLPDDTP